MSERNPKAADSLGQPHPYIDMLTQSLYKLIEDLRNTGVDAIRVLAIAKNLAIYEAENRITLLQEIPEDIEHDANYTVRKLAKKAEDPKGSISELTDMGVPIESARTLIDNLKYILEARVGVDELVGYYLGSMAAKGADMFESAKGFSGNLRTQLTSMPIKLFSED